MSDLRYDALEAERDELAATLARVRAELDHFLATFIDRLDFVTTDDGSFLDYIDHEQVEADLTAIRAALGPTALEACDLRRDALEAERDELAATIERVRALLAGESRAPIALAVRAALGPAPAQAEPEILRT